MDEDRVLEFTGDGETVVVDGVTISLSNTLKNFVWSPLHMDNIWTVYESILSFATPKETIQDAAQFVQLTQTLCYDLASREGLSLRFIAVFGYTIPTCDVLFCFGVWGFLFWLCVCSFWFVLCLVGRWFSFHLGMVYMHNEPGSL